MSDPLAHRLAPITPRRVVITGMSVATALGFEVEELTPKIAAYREARAKAGHASPTFFLGVTSLRI